MKIRGGFVSNSSSTSFTFIFKGDKIEDLFNLIKKYNQYFDLYFTDSGEKELHCTAEDVIKSMEEIKPNLKIENINSLRLYIKTRMRDLEITSEKNKDHHDWYSEYLSDCMDKELLMEEAAKREFTNALVIDFGDNSGVISGGTVGYCMDYEGRSININKPDLIVTTEQNR